MDKPKFALEEAATRLKKDSQRMTTDPFGLAAWYDNTSGDELVAAGQVWSVTVFETADRATTNFLDNQAKLLFAIGEDLSPGEDFGDDT